MVVAGVGYAEVRTLARSGATCPWRRTGTVGASSQIALDEALVAGNQCDESPTLTEKGQVKTRSAYSSKRVLH